MRVLVTSHVAILNDQFGNQMLLGHALAVSSINEGMAVGTPTRTTKYNRLATKLGYTKFDS